MKKLPIGRQIFEEIRSEELLYVDKTRYIYDILTGTGAKQFFLSRPRRFGKTLMCWTLNALFSGKRELFEGLAIAGTDWAWESYPVIHLDMSRVDTSAGIDGVRESLRQQTEFAAGANEVDINGITLPSGMLNKMFQDISKKRGKPAVVIVDEYDKPFLDFYAKPPVAQEVREIMRGYYITFKANEQHIRFLFMTGISKFAKMGVFSTLNQITDISLDEKYGALCGYTEEELLGNFGEHLEAGAKKLNCPVDELVEKMRAYYNGFCFDGVQKVYNPFSALNFLNVYKFKNFWIDSANPRIIADYMRDRNLTVEQFIGMEVSEDFVSNPGEMETAPAEGFLYQAGYLTLREGVADDFSLDYPNVEVFQSMSQLVTNNIAQYGGGNYFIDFRAPLFEALRDGSVDLFIETINRLLSSIPYDDYAKSAQRSIRRAGVPAREWLYRATILAFLHGCGVMALGEHHTSKGRSDLLICHKGAAWVVEFKVAYNDDSAAKAKEALEQITARRYDGPFKAAKKMGLAIDDKKGQIVEWVE